MSKLYRVDMKIDVSKSTPNGGFLLKKVDKEVDKREFIERTGAEVFGFLCDASIGGANPKVSYDQGKTFRKISKDLAAAEAKGEYIANKTDLDIIKNSLKGNPNWPNTDEMFEILEQIMGKLDNAENINENPSSGSAGKDSQQEK